MGNAGIALTPGIRLFFQYEKTGRPDNFQPQALAVHPRFVQGLDKILSTPNSHCLPGVFADGIGPAANQLQ